MEFVQLRNELLKKCEVFYDSIEKQFVDSDNKIWYYKIIEITSIITAFLLIFSLIPLIPYLIGKIDLVTNIQLSETVSFKDFNTRWILCSATFFTINFPVNKLHEYVKKEHKNKSLNPKYLAFAYLYKTISFIENFTINGLDKNLDSAEEYFDKYYDRCFLFISLDYIPETITEITKKRSWIELKEQSIDLLNGFDYFYAKIYERLVENFEIDLTLEVLRDLLCYEFILTDRFTKKMADELKVNTKMIEHDLLLTASSKVSELDYQNVIEDSTKPPKNTFKAIIGKLGSLFTNHNLIITFLMWFALFALIMLIAIYFGTKGYGIEMDSTILIGAISAIFICAVTISVAVFSKRKND